MGEGFSAAGRTLFHRRWRKRPCPNLKGRFLQSWCSNVRHTLRSAKLVFAPFMLDGCSNLTICYGLFYPTIFMLAYLVDVVKLFHNFSLAILDLAARDCNNPCKLNRSFEFVFAHNIYFFKYLIVIMYLKMRTGSHAVGHARPHGQRNYTFPLCRQEP